MLAGCSRWHPAQAFGILPAMHQYRLLHRPTQRELVVRGRRDHLEPFTGFEPSFPWEQHALAIERAIFRRLSTDEFEVTEKSKLSEH
jgi:hypothetical protein